MKKILIATLGNRDLQLLPDALVRVNIQDHFERGGTDTGSNLIIKKTGGSFLANSKSVLDAYETLAYQVCFPMVETYLAQMDKQCDMVVLVSTKQIPLDSQDCCYVAQFLEKWLKNKGYNVDFYPLECAPVNFPALVEDFTLLYDGYRNDQIFVGNSGGTPELRAASYAAGFFRGIQFITLQARDKQVNVTNFVAQEKLVLKHVVEGMLANFNYSGLLQLPIEDKQMKSLAEYALARLSLDFDRANEIAKYIEDKKLLIPSNIGIREKEREVWVSAKIKFQQKAWGDYLWRLFLIQDNLWIPLVEEKLGGTVSFKKDSGFKEWKDLLNKQPKLIEFLKEQKLGYPTSRPLDYEKPVKVIFEFVIRYFNQENALQSVPKMNLYFELNKIMDASMRDLRNGVAHNYKGINREIIETELKEKSRTTIEELHQKLTLHTGIAKDSFGIYDDLNIQILKIFY
jgi:hypothetical protein